ncbi:DEAD/DEAH box helicase family protein [Herbidospora sp. RD11066]
MDARIQELARRSPNFGRLLQYEPLLVLDGAGAESYVYTDPNASLVKARQFGEALAAKLVVLTGTRVNGDRQLDRLTALSQAGVLVPRIQNAFHQLRTLGNEAVHSHYGEVRVALNAVRTCFELGVWFYRAIQGDAEESREQIAFVPPPDPITQATSAGDQAELVRIQETLEAERNRLTEVKVRLDEKTSRFEAERRAREEAEQELSRATADRDHLRALIDQLNTRLNEFESSFADRMRSAKRPTAGDREIFIEKAIRAAREPRTEREVREEVDRMLVAAGWDVQDAGREDLFAGDGVAVREAQTATGPADYLLYVDRKMVGVVEAKREGTALGAVERQSARYAEGLKASQQIQAWRLPLPFRYETTAVETRFTYTLDPDWRARDVHWFHRPETLARWMREADKNPDLPTLRAKLRQGLPELADPRLRPAQDRAVRGVEAKLQQGKPRALIQMATGAGKTFTAVTLSYRLLKYAGAARVLFLVDRNNLGEQAHTEFTNYVTADDGRKFSELYNVQRLSGAGMLDSSKVVISTVQRLYAMLRGQEPPAPEVEDETYDTYDVDEAIELGYNRAVPPETFDLIVIDECHRSIYGKWRAVLEYFDASLIGLTATPVAQTFGFFHQELASEYTYTEAVADGVNVDFNVYRIRTEITEQGAKIEAGTVVPKRDRRTRRQRYEELDDDFTYSGKQLGRHVISKGQLKLVLETFRDRLFTEIFPPLPGQPSRSYVPKTLIYAVDDNHAQEIVEMTRETFGKGNEFCQKITYAAKDATKLISAFRNSPELRIAVTVTMIATGTDIRPLECVFFLNEVKSWALFEQMKGRGARTLDPAELKAVTPDVKSKDRFVIVDAVGVTDSPRVDATPLEQHSEKQIALKQLLSKAGNLTISAKETSTLAGRLARLNKQITPDERAELEALTGRPLTEVIASLAETADPEWLERARAGGSAVERTMVEQAVRPLADPKFRRRLLEIRNSHEILTDEGNRDTLLDARGVGRGETAERIIESWAAYVSENRDELTALELAYRHGTGGRAVYQKLKELTSRIARPPHQWTPDRLWEAYQQVGLAAAQPDVKHGPADLIALIRHELGLLEGEVQPHRNVIEERFSAWLARQEQSGARFTGDQVWWLEKIRDVVAISAGFDHNDLGEVPFTERGGIDGFLRTFGDEHAESILDDLNRDLTA